MNADCSDSDGGKILSANDGYAGGDTVNVGVDFKKITVLAGGENVVSPMPDKNGIDCRFVKRKIAVTEEVNGKKRCPSGLKSEECFSKFPTPFRRKCLPRSA